MMHLRFLLLFLLASFTATAQQEDTYEITVDIDGYESDILTLGYYLMNNQYIIDTASRSATGEFVFSSDTSALQPGIYLVVLSPDNNYFQLVISDDGDQEFTLATSMDSLNNVRVTGSEENKRFYDYLGYLADRQAESAQLQEAVRDSVANPAGAQAAEEALSQLDVRVKAYQESVMRDHPDAFVSAIIRSNQPAIPPDFEDIADEEQRRTRQWRWLQDHYFDGLDLRDARLLRTPFLFQRVDYYVNSLQVKHPDTLAAAIDRVLARFDPESEAYKYFVVHYTNEAASSNIVGMDALYVHMVDAYYRNGKAYWADAEQQGKMIETAERLKPLLIGQRAPDMEMITRAGNDTTLYDIEADYTILYFWRYDCAACKKSTPVMKEFYEAYRDKGVKIFSVCTKGIEEIGDCWDYVDEQGTGDWVQVVDPYQRYYRNYDIKSTPTIFVLDRDKQIVSKRIGAEQLGEVIDNLRERSTQSAGR